MGMYFWPASMTGGEVRSAWFGVRNGIAPVVKEPKF